MLRIAALASSVVASIATVLPLSKPDLDQPLLHPGEHRPMRLHDRSGAASAKSSSDRAAASCSARPHETADRQRIGRPPRDAALRVDAFEVADQQQPEIPARRQTRPAHDRGVELATLVFDEPVEAVRVQASRSIARRTDAPATSAGPTSAIHNGGWSVSRVPIAMRGIVVHRPRRRRRLVSGYRLSPRAASAQPELDSATRGALGHRRSRR